MRLVTWRAISTCPYTLDAELFNRYFGGAPSVKFPGRAFPVTELYLEVGPGRNCSCPSTHCSRSFLEVKSSVGSGIEVLVSNPARSIRSVHFRNLTDPPAGSPTWSRSLRL